MKTTIHYQVSVNGNRWLSPEGYSKYYKRLSEYNKQVDAAKDYKSVTYDPYGFDQCVEHIAEHYGRQDEYTEKRQKDTLTIQRVTTITEEVPYTPIDPIISFRNKSLTIADEDKH